MKKDLNDMANTLGVDIFRVVAVHDFNDAPEGHRPRDIMPNAKSIIVLGMKFLDAQVDILPIHEKEDFRSPRQDMYAGHNNIVARRLDDIGYALARFLEKRGFKAYHQMASTGGTDQRYLVGLLSLKHMAARAGLGVFGYHSLIITPQYGPRVRLAAILTDAEMEPDMPLNGDVCKDCRGTPCISLCPVGALRRPSDDSPYEINKYACRQYLNTRPTCSICVKVCPTGSERII